MKTERLERRIERLKAENEKLRQENERLKEAAPHYAEKEKLLDETMAEYQALIASLKKSREYYKVLIHKLREYDGKMERKYNKAVNSLIKEAKQ
jgi:cell division septum initiation protein DivIVA